jgi:hypothetical protein
LINATGSHTKFLTLPQRPAADRERRPQQVQTLVGLQVAPVHQDHRPALAHQLADQTPIEALDYTVQMTVAEQPIESLQWRTHPLRTRK